MNTSTTTAPALNLSDFTTGSGERRRYVNNWLEIFGFEATYYKTGNIASATINGGDLSNAAATRLKGVKVWIDDQDAVHVDRWADGTERYSITKQEIIDTITAIHTKEN